MQNLSTGAVLCLLIAVLSLEAHAFRKLDGTGDDNGAVLIYTFDALQTNGAEPNTVTSVPDSSGTGFHLTPSRLGNLSTTADLRIKATALPSSNSTTIVLSEKPLQDSNGNAGYQLAQKDRSFLWNPNPASAMNSCGASGLTIQAFVRPYFPFQGVDSANDGNMIVGLSNSDPSETLNTTGNNNVQVPNFAIYQSGGDGDAPRVLLKIRGQNGQAMNFFSSPNFISTTKAENVGRWNEIIATMDASGNVGVYLNRMPQLFRRSQPVAFLPGARLVMGNELVRLNSSAPIDPQTGSFETEQLVKDQRNWSGEISHVAVYCRGFSSDEISGDIAANKLKYAIVAPDLSKPITPARQFAQKMMSRLAGVVVPIDHPDVIKMEAFVAAGDLVSAAKIATGDKSLSLPGHPGFLNVVVKQMALQMSNREETVRVPLNDFAAAFVGFTRDETNAKELLTGDFYYMADPNKAPIPSDLKNDILETNRHYQQLDSPSAEWDIGKVLVRVEGQKISKSSNGEIVAHPDPAGILTSRAWLAAHAKAGTNRRLIEYTMREFMCTPMEGIADTSASTARIGRDVDRMPAGDSVKFETTCKGCHTIMDGFRGAFGKFDFNGDSIDNGIILHSAIHGVRANQNDRYGFAPGGTGGGPMALDNGIVNKLNHNNNLFPFGHRTTDESFLNNANTPKNRNFFGWRGSNANGGYGAGQFGQMIADSKRFSQCMAKRVYESVCLPGKDYNFEKVKPMVFAHGDKFEQGGYNLRKLFQEVAGNAACIKP